MFITQFDNIFLRGRLRGYDRLQKKKYHKDLKM